MKTTILNGNPRKNWNTALTMNAPKTFYNLAYRKKAKEVAQSFKALNGEVEVYACCDTLQVDDYSKYNVGSFNKKQQEFPQPLQVVG